MLLPIQRIGLRFQQVVHDVGSGFTAQSPYTNTWSGNNMKNTDEIIELPGAVLMICIGGRMVFAVV